jgi:glycosyltransferase involved in cell wall biosynthesis
MTTSPRTLSVVMATFNGEAYIEAQLDSILQQTRLPDEIVISDDGSTDNTVEVVTRIQAASPGSVSWQVVTNQTPLGVAGNFLSAAKRATGELIALADQDDWWVPGKLRTLEDTLVGSDALLVHSDAEVVDQAGNLLGMSVSDSLRMTRGERRGLIAGRGLEQLVRRNLVTGHTVVMRREVVELAGDIPSGWLHDEWWALVAAAHGRVVLCPQILGHYRQHEINQVGATKSGFARLMERFGEPQEEFRARHRTRHEGLLAFVEKQGSVLPESSTRLLRGRIGHYIWQATLPASRLLRVGPVVWRVVTGNYHRYRRGIFDALRDLMQPGHPKT